MRRSDRLFEIIQIIRDGRLHLAREIADKVEVSIRTVYRDVDTLIASGIPIEGERGVGYLLREPIFLPPLTLSLAEMEALHLGMAIVAEAADQELQKASQSLLAKISQVIPERNKPKEKWAFAVYPFNEAQSGFQHMPKIRKSIQQKQKLNIEYRAIDGSRSSRTIWPLQTEYWGRVWTCTCWCEMQNSFRVFRIDRIIECETNGVQFSAQPGKTLDDFLRYMDYDKFN
jgi:predicted DNA-binding transcriptional regulator YafY